VCLGDDCDFSGGLREWGFLVLGGAAGVGEVETDVFAREGGQVGFVLEHALDELPAWREGYSLRFISDRYL
jgi:hypothetical protein